MANEELSNAQPPKVWEVVKASALRRLGKPLLLAYLGLVAFALVVIVVSLLAMRFS